MIPNHASEVTGSDRDRLLCRTLQYMIRPYTEADSDDLVRVWLASTIPGQAFLPEEYWRAMEPAIRGELVPVADVWVFEVESTMVAFLALLGTKIGGLFTHPDHQGKGYGGALVEHASSLHDPLFVDVFEANEAAIGFYRSLGFVDNERRIDDESGLELLTFRLASG